MPKLPNLRPDDCVLLEQKVSKFPGILSIMPCRECGYREIQFDGDGFDFAHCPEAAEIATLSLGDHIRRHLEMVCIKGGSCKECATQGCTTRAMLASAI